MPSVASSLAPPLCELDWPHQYRIVSSSFPAIAFFETLVDPERMEALYYLEGLTNARLRDEVGASHWSIPRTGSVGRAHRP